MIVAHANSNSYNSLVLFALLFTSAGSNLNYIFKFIYEI